MYLYVRTKFTVAFILSVLWVATAVYLAIPWYFDLVEMLYRPVPEVIVLGLAIIPRWALSFTRASLWLDRRPKYVERPFAAPPLTVLIAAFNEEGMITETLH